MPEDRAKISRVIHNRLFFSAVNPDAPFPLQIDATVLYGRDQAGLDPELPFSQAPHDRHPVQHLSASRAAPHADRSARARLDPSSAEPGAEPAGRRPDLRRTRRTRPSASTCTTSSPTRTAATCSPPSCGSTSATSSWPARPGCCEPTPVGGADRLTGRTQPVAGDPPGGIRRGRCRRGPTSRSTSRAGTVLRRSPPCACSESPGCR